MLTEGSEWKKKKEVFLLLDVKGTNKRNITENL
jgi:hypothetical protein